MNKAYLVKNVHLNGTETVIGVCPTIELARLLKQRSENLHDLKDSDITAEIWENMVNAYREANDTRQMYEVLIELFPEYSVKDIEEAYYYYEHRSYQYTYITKIDMFTNEMDIIKWK